MCAAAADGAISVDIDRAAAVLAYDDEARYVRSDGGPAACDVNRCRGRRQRQFPRVGKVLRPEAWYCSRMTGFAHGWHSRTAVCQWHQVCVHWSTRECHTGPARRPAVSRVKHACQFALAAACGAATWLGRQLRQRRQYLRLGAGGVSQSALQPGPRTTRGRCRHRIRLASRLQ